MTLPDILDRYLVAGYQNPRLNVQAILVRHVLLADVLGDGVGPAMEDEIRFAIDLNEAIRLEAAKLSSGVSVGEPGTVGPVCRQTDVHLAAVEVYLKCVLDAVELCVPGALDRRLP